MLLTFDFPKRELRTAPLPPTGGVEEAAMAPQSAAAAKRDRFVPAGMQNWTAAFRQGQSLLVPVSIGTGPQRLFILDTGMEIGLIKADVAREIATVIPRPGDSLRGLNGVTRNLAAIGAIDVAFSGYSGRVREMTVMNDLSGFAPIGAVQVPGFIGFDVLRTLVLSIDYRDGLVRAESVVISR